jgi:hypothetical protein
VTLPHDAMIGLERSAIGNGHPIYARQIAWLPVCVLFLFARPPDPFSNRTETFDSLEPPPGSEEPKIWPALVLPSFERSVLA